MTLTNQDIEGFVENGFTFVRGALSNEFIKRVWGAHRQFLDHLRGYDTETHLFFPRRQEPWSVNNESPRLDQAINQLIGGEDRALAPKIWGDGFVVAQPAKRLSTDLSSQKGAKYLWHVDGFHRHFLDSPEIGVVALVMWTDSSVFNGATVLAQNSIKIIADKLVQNPEGLDGDFFDKNRMIDSTWEPQVRAEGNAGDVCLMHPFLLHSIQQNLSNDFRAVSNPVVPLAMPMNFNRADQRYSPVERAVLRALNVQSLDYIATGVRGVTTTTNLSNKYTMMRTDLKEQMDGFFLSR